MALIENTLFGKVDKVKTAIERIKTFDPSQSEQFHGYAPYYVVNPIVDRTTGDVWEFLEHHNAN